MKRILVVGAVVLLTACAEDAKVDQVPEAVRPARIFQVVAEGASNELEFVGRVEAAQTVDVSFEVGGPLAQLPVLEGQTVPAGALIAALDPTDFLLAVREAEVQRTLAAQDFERKRKLLADRGISQSVVDDARARFELTQVHLAQAREALEDTRVVAPFEAYVARRYTDNHVIVKSGDKIARLTDLNQLLVRVNVPEHILATATADRVLSRQAVFSFAPNQRFDLEFREVSGEADPVAQTYQVTFAMRPPGGFNVMPGVTAAVFVEMATAQELATRIPATALVGGSGEELFVWVFDLSAGSVEKRQVQVGVASGSGVPVLSGLRHGELIVSAGASQLRNGMRVRMLGDLITDI